MFPLSVRHGNILLLDVLIMLGLLTSSLTQAQAYRGTVMPAADTAALATTPQTFGYGFVVADWRNTTPVQLAGFNWMLVFDPPVYSDRATLLRIKVTTADAADLMAFYQRLSTMNLGVASAVQIGNEPNLISEWGAPPNAASYKTTLCMAYNTFRQIHPAVTVVSAGLAPTGRVPGSWDGHAGHDGQKQDEREFLREFITAGGGNCLDAVGYNALGFRANYDAAPDVNGGTPDTDCANGLCFRSVEKAYEIMQAYGFGNKPFWATEVGWLTTPPSYCLTDPRWPSRTWQIVTPDQQAENLVGAFRYARFHWPWMQAMFVFNLDFSSAPWYDECEQMRYYSVTGQPAFMALWWMPKQVFRQYYPAIRK